MKMSNDFRIRVIKDTIDDWKIKPKKINTKSSQNPNSFLKVVHAQKGRLHLELDYNAFLKAMEELQKKKSLRRAELEEGG